MGIPCQFERKVAHSLAHCLDQAGIELSAASCIGVAVSGGADSVSLLYALKEISPCRIVAVTVNHNLRGEEGDQDALFVEHLCEVLGVECTRCDIPQGQIQRAAQESFTSVEAAAHKERYGCFDAFILQKGLCALCLAHNREDQLETVLMRFLQGSSALWAIPTTRGKYIRPLLNISRKEILSYLHEKHATFCTDSTNADPSFLRNKIRGQLVPLLDKEFAGWQEGVLTLCAKARSDEDFIQEAAGGCLERLGYQESCDEVSFGKEAFFSLAQALRRRVVQKAVEFLAPQRRLSHSFLDQVFAFPHKAGSSFYAAGIAVRFEGSRVVMQKVQRREGANLATEHGFFAIITQEGLFEAGGFSVRTCAVDGGILLEAGEARVFLKGLCFPFVFRSHQTGDRVRCADGTFRSAAKVLDGWKAGGFRDAIPFVQQLVPTGLRQPIRCIWGSILGFADWVVNV